MSSRRLRRSRGRSAGWGSDGFARQDSGSGIGARDRGRRWALGRAIQRAICTGVQAALRYRRENNSRPVAVSRHRPPVHGRRSLRCTGPCEPGGCGAGARHDDEGRRRSERLSGQLVCRPADQGVVRLQQQSADRLVEPAHAASSSGKASGLVISRPAQRDAAMAVVAAALSPSGYKKVNEIMDGDEVLKNQGGGRTGGRQGGRHHPCLPATAPVDPPPARSRWRRWPRRDPVRQGRVLPRLPRCAVSHRPVDSPVRRPSPRDQRHRRRLQ